VKESALIPVEKIEKAIYMIRGEKVILDADLASLYGLETRVLIQAVKRNLQRFPIEFAFQLSSDEYKSLRSQFVISKGRGGRRYLPYAFTEHGAIMAANVLNGKRAVRMSVFVVRAFVKLRETALQHKELAAKIAELERKVGTHDQAIASTIAAIRQLMSSPARERKQIGFTTKPAKT
jgi:phage regulator Rha-like protein